VSDEHAVLSPSSAHRWSLCHGAPAACKGVPNTDSEDAARGSVKHWMGEQCLKRGGDAVQFLGHVLTHGDFAFTVDDTFVKQVQSYIDAVRSAVGRREVEIRLDTSGVLGVPGQFGRSDAVILNRRDKSIEVWDAKFGFGRVYAKGNKQGLIYLAAALDFYDIYDTWERGKFVIHQPAIDHYDEAEYTIADVRAFLDEIRPAAMRAWAMYTGETPIELTPGPEQCEWCPIRGECKARTQGVLEMFPTDFQDTEPDVPMLTDEELAAALARVDEIRSWCVDMETEAMRRAKSGAKLPGYKLVQGKKGNRFWLDKPKAETTLVSIMSEAAYLPRELISPTTAEEKLGKSAYATVKSLVGQNDGALQLVPQSHPKPEVQVTTLEFNTTEENVHASLL